MPKVSVITPCYNAEKYIVKAIKSLQAETFADWEHIIKPESWQTIFHLFIGIGTIAELRLSGFN